MLFAVLAVLPADIVARVRRTEEAGYLGDCLLLVKKNVG